MLERFESSQLSLSPRRDDDDLDDDVEDEDIDDDDDLDLDAVATEVVGLFEHAMRARRP